MNQTRLLIAAFVALSMWGCKGDGTVNNKPDYVADPTALSFSACPTKDETGGAVADVFPDQQIVTIRNQGKAGGTLAVDISGTDKAAFSLVAAETPDAVGPSSSVEFPVRFSPAKKGDSKATLTIDDGNTETMPITVDLVGTGKNLPAQPTIEAAIESYAAPNTFTQVCKAGTPVLDCQQAYQDTLLKDSTTLRIKLRNKGCPALKVTGIELTKGSAGADNMAFFLDQPSTTPSMSNPIIMSAADHTEELTLLIRFAPESDGSGDSQRYADLTITTNDPATPTLVLGLSGNGIEPAIYAVPSFCNFNDMSDNCRPSGAKVANEAVFEITNGGSSNVKIDSATFKSSGMNATGTGGRFTVAAPIDNQMLTPGQKATLTIAHHDMPLFVVDTVTVSASVPGQAAGSAGKVFLTVAGGIEPCLETDPDTTLEFLDAGTTSVLPVKVKALATKPGGAPCGDLLIDGVEIPTNPFFSVAAPMITAGTKVTAGQSATINVEYKKPVTGGRQATDLIIKTNDLTYGAPSFKKLLVQSASPLNQIPVAVLKGCLPTELNCSMNGVEQTMNVNLSQISPKEITLWAGDSYDPGNPTQPGIGEWQFAYGPPAGAMNSSITGGNGMYTMMNSQKLILDPVAIGTYRVSLLVKDDTGQRSGTAANLSIIVRP